MSVRAAAAPGGDHRAEDGDVDVGPRARIAGDAAVLDQDADLVAKAEQPAQQVLSVRPERRAVNLGDRAGVRCTGGPGPVRFLRFGGPEGPHESRAPAGLRETTAEQARLRETTAEQARLRETTAEQARLRETTAEQARLRETTAEQARLRETTAEQARLRETTAEQARLRETTAEQARLRETTAEQARLRETAEQARLRETTAEQARLRETTAGPAGGGGTAAAGCARGASRPS